MIVRLENGGDGVRAGSGRFHGRRCFARVTRHTPERTG